MAKKVKDIKPEELFDEQSVKDGDILGSGPYLPSELLDNSNNFVKLSIDKSIPPSRTSLEWNDYILSQFDESEMFQGNPTLDGLRRIAEHLIGDIVSSTTSVIQCPCPENEKRATAICKIVFKNDTSLIEFMGAADSCWQNTDKVYRNYPVALAENRAEARALRKALRLKVVSAEEVSEAANNDNDQSLPTLECNDKITQNQINFLEILSNLSGRGLNINIEAMVKDKYPNCKNLKELTHSEALVLIETLSNYQKNISSIPTNIVGFVTDWKEQFCK